jgi:hypothetical protein
LLFDGNHLTEQGAVLVARRMRSMGLLDATTPTASPAATARTAGVTVEPPGDPSSVVVAPLSTQRQTLSFATPHRTEPAGGDAARPALS